MPAQVTSTVRKVAVGAAKSVVAVTNLVRTLEAPQASGSVGHRCRRREARCAPQVDPRDQVVLVLGAEGTGLGI